MEKELRFGAEDLDRFTAQVLERLGLPPEDARAAAEVLGQANLRGVDTHGTGLLPAYVQRIRSGMVNPRPNMRVLRETAAALVVDADGALGQVSSRWAMELAIAKAREAGVAWVNVVNSNHHGALAFYALMAAQQDMLGLVTTTTSANTAPWGGKEPVVGNNPLAVAAPAGRHRPLVLDMAMSLFANGKVRLALDRGQPLPEGLAMDPEGEPTTDPTKVAALFPFGAYKGSGLSMMLGIMAGVLVGAPFTGYPRGSKTGAGPSEIAHLMVAVDISAFDDVADFKERVDAVIDRWKATATRPGFEEVLVPGEPEWRRVEERRSRGVPLDAPLVERLRRIGQELEVEFPAPL